MVIIISSLRTSGYMHRSSVTGWVQKGIALCAHGSSSDKNLGRQDVGIVQFSRTVPFTAQQNRATRRAAKLAFRRWSRRFGESSHPPPSKVSLLSIPRRCIRCYCRHRFKLIRSFFRSCLNKQSFLQCGHQNLIEKHCDRISWWLR